MIGGLGPTELIVILAIVALLFGGKKIPEMARGLGKGVSEFKRGMRELEDAARTVQETAEPESE